MDLLPLPLFLDVIALVFYLFFLFDNKKKLDRVIFYTCLLLLVFILPAPIIWVGTLFALDHPSSMQQFYTFFFSVNSYPLILMALGFFIAYSHMKRHTKEK